jgi:hypothetical protein
MDTAELLEQLRHLGEHPPDDLRRLRDEMVALIFAVDDMLYPEPEPASR